MTQPWDYAIKLRGKAWVTPPGGGAPYRVIVQGAGPINATHTAPDGSPIQVRAYHVPTDPQTPAQLARRAIMADAIAAWRAADAATRESARATAIARHLPLFHAWISDWLHSHHDPDPHSHWDTGTSSWDAGTSHWDTAN